MSATDVLGNDQIKANLAQLPQWRYGLGAFRTVLTCESSAVALSLFAAIGELAQDANHHPDVDWRYDTLFIALTSHDAGGTVTARDAALARSISSQATAMGATAHPELLRTVELALDTDNPAAISAMWKTALGYRELPDGSLVDGFGRGPAIWFQNTETPNSNRFHVDVTVPFDQSIPILRALEAAGAVLDHTDAPRWVVATDAQGNRLCICTEEGRL